MSDQPPLELELDGRIYRRYPASKNKSHERYYVCVSSPGFRTYHRDLWEKHFGPIPEGYHVHHKDEDFFNNTIGNYECLSPAEHGARHSGGDHSEWSRQHINSIRHLASEWHGSEEGLAWHSEHGKRTWVDRKLEPSGKCNNCGKELLSYFAGRGEKRYCSRKCHRAVADSEKRYFVDADCPICKSVFKVRKWGKRPKTCSRVCGQRLRKSLASGPQIHPR